MTNESSLGVNTGASDAGAIQAGGSPPPSPSSGAPDTGQWSADLNVQPDRQGEQQPTQTSADDPLAGFPSDDDLQAAINKRDQLAPIAGLSPLLGNQYQAANSQVEALVNKSNLELSFKIYS